MIEATQEILEAINMKTMRWNEAKSGAWDPARRWNYVLLAENLNVDGFHCESYGIMVQEAGSGKETSVRNITVNSSEALALLHTAVRMEVSPIHLRDMVEDYLGQ